MKTLVSILTVVAASAVAVGCGEDDLLPPPPDPGGALLTLDNAWPSEDRRYWEYASTERVWRTALIDSAYVYPDSSSVPSPPTLGDILGWLANPKVPTPGSITRAHFRLRFDGERLTAFGRTTQNLLEEWAPFIEPNTSFETRFTTQLGFIRSGFQLTDGVYGVSDHVTLDPVFLHGGAWEKSATVIGTYGDLDPGLAWKFLDGDMDLGDSFALPVFGGTLRAWVQSRAAIETAVGRFEDALVCVYLFDLGITCATTVFQPDAHDCYRLFYFGRVYYVPTVGPVFAFERHAAAAGDPDAEGWGDITLSLTGLRAGDGDN